MGEVFKNVLVLSLTGTAVSVVLLMIKPFTRKVFSPVWQYYIWIVALVAYIVPVSFNVNIIRNEDNGFDMPVIEYENKGNVQVISENTEKYTADNVGTDVINVNADYVDVLALCWFAAALGIFIYRIIQYNIFLKTLKRYSEDHINIDNIPAGLKTKKTTLVDAPLVIGLFKPVLYIPDVEISREGLEYIINHELTHYRRGDIIYKWFVMIVSCVHWFNPVIYFLIKNIDEDCEISCDYIVTKNMSENERTGYMNTILELICRSVKNKSMLSTNMAGSKKILKRRFDVIKKGRKYKLYVSVISIAAAILLISAYAFAGSGINNRIFDNSNAVLSNEDYSVKNILVMGDDNRGRINIAMLLSFDKGSGVLNIIPIETSLILDNDKNINEIVSERGEDEGISAIENALSSDIDNYIKINSAAIGEITDCLGGISVDIEEGLYYSDPNAGVDFYIDEGMQVLSGEEINALLLYRGNTDGEITKCELQGKIVSEIIRQMYNKENRDKINNTEEIINRNAEETDFEEGVIYGIKSVFNRSISAIKLTELLADEQTNTISNSNAAERGYIANYDLIHDPLFDAENIKYSRDYIGDELNRIDKLIYEYQWNNMKPSKSMNERTADEGMYFDIKNNMVVYPERELTDDEILALVEFQADINSLYEQNRGKPVNGMISEQEAVETAKNEILYFYGVVSSDYNISCGYNEAGEDGYGPDKNMFSVMFEPVDMPYLAEQSTDYHVYFVDIEAETGDVITVDSYYSGMKADTEEVNSLTADEKSAFEKKSREVMRNIPNLGNVKEQYINPSGGRSVCTVFELDGKELKVELTYPNMEKVGWSVEG